MKKKIENLHKSKRFRISYQVIFIFLALYSFVTTILDLHGDISIFNNPILEFVDVSIYLIFAADYFIRFTHSDNKLNFIENNIPDLISIIPYYSIFRLFRIFKIRRLARVFKHLKLTKTYLSIKKFYKKIKKILRANGLIYLLIFAVLGIIVSALIVSYVEKLSYFNGLWWAFVTATTVGYGDVYPHTFIGRIIAIFLILIGMGTFGMITGAITSYFLNRQADLIPDDDLDEYILNSPNYTDAEKQDIISFIQFVRNKRKK